MATKIFDSLILQPVEGAPNLEFYIPGLATQSMHAGVAYVASPVPVPLNAVLNQNIQIFGTNNTPNTIATWAGDNFNLSGDYHIDNNQVFLTGSVILEGDGAITTAYDTGDNTIFPGFGKMYTIPGITYESFNGPGLRTDPAGLVDITGIQAAVDDPNFTVLVYYNQGYARVTSWMTAGDYYSPNVSPGGTVFLFDGLFNKNTIFPLDVKSNGCFFLAYRAGTRLVYDDLLHAQNDEQIAVGDLSLGRVQDYGKAPQARSGGSLGYLGGDGCWNLNDYCHVEGVQTIGIHNNINIHGYRTVTTAPNQFVCGNLLSATLSSSNPPVKFGGLGELFTVQSSFFVSESNTLKYNFDFEILTDLNGSGLIVLPWVSSSTILSKIPSNPKTGSAFINIVTATLNIYNGTAWKSTSFS